MERKRILTGDRPTGKLHLGHYVGSLANRVRLQDEYNCYFIVADLHMLTTKPEKENIDALRQNTREMVLDYLAAGIDPQRSTIYLQSAVHAVYEMNLIFEMLVSVPRLRMVCAIDWMRSDISVLMLLGTYRSGTCGGTNRIIAEDTKVSGHRNATTTATTSPASIGAAIQLLFRRTISMKSSGSICRRGMRNGSCNVDGGVFGCPGYMLSRSSLRVPSARPR